MTYNKHVKYVILLISKTFVSVRLTRRSESLHYRTFETINFRTDLILSYATVLSEEKLIGVQPVNNAFLKPRLCKEYVDYLFS